MADNIEKIEAVTKVTKSEDALAKMIERQQENLVIPNKQYFDALMREEGRIHTEQAQTMRNEAVQKPTPMETAADANRAKPREDLKVNGIENDAVTTATKKPSPMEEAAKVHGKRGVGPSPVSDLVVQAENAVQQIQTIKEQLNTPNLKFKSSVQNLLQNKLTQVDGNLRVAANKAGLDYAPPEAVQDVTNPIHRFLGYLTHSQQQLESLGDYFQYLHENRESVSPANVLAIQIKVHNVQTELEFFTSLLNKTLEGTKTIMNVQS